MDKNVSAKPSMSLRQFVSESLSQIVSGVSDAHGENRRIAPPVAQRADLAYAIHRDGVNTPAAFIVDFDVAVTVSKKSDTTAKGGISIHVLEAGADRTTSAEHSTVSRIKFQVPVTFDEVSRAAGND